MKNQPQPKKLRIFWNSNAQWATSGYANQVADLLPQMRDAGYPLAICNFFGQQGGKFVLDGILQYPVINHVYGSDALLLHARDFKADVVFTLQDIWVLHPNDLQQTNRWIPYLPVDHDPVPKNILQNLRFAWKIVTYSKFGQKQLQNHGLYSTYIPHTVNTEIFKPMNTPERKQLAGLPPDSYIFGMVAANKENPPRKSFQEVLDAFKLFLAKEPKALLYIHTNPDFPGGFPIRDYANFIGVGDKLFTPDPYVMNFNTGKEQMALIYNTFDCLLMPSISEGFGVPAIEAQACGVPVIVNNFTSMPELVKPGVTGEVCELIPGPSGKRFSAAQSYMGIPDTQSLFEKMVSIYQADRGKMKKAAREWIESEYALDKVFTERWMPYLARLERETYPTVDTPLQKRDNTIAELPATA